LEGECKLNTVSAESTKILLDPHIHKTIEKHLKKRKSKPSYQYKRLKSKLPYHDKAKEKKEKEKRDLQLAEMKRIKGFSIWNGPNVNLRVNKGIMTMTD
jgi:hypothetical protein